MDRAPRDSREAQAGTRRFSPPTREVAALLLDVQAGNDLLDRIHQPLDMRLGVSRRAGNPQQVLRSRRTKDWIDVNPLLEQHLTQQAELGIAVKDYRYNRSFAVEQRKSSRFQFAAQQVRDSQEVRASFGFGLDDAQR